MKFEAPAVPDLAFAEELVRGFWFAWWSLLGHHHCRFPQSREGCLPSVLLPTSEPSSLLRLLNRGSLCREILEGCLKRPGILESELVLHLMQPSCKD